MISSSTQDPESRAAMWVPAGSPAADLGISWLEWLMSKGRGRRSPPSGSRLKKVIRLWTPPLVIRPLSRGHTQAGGGFTVPPCLHEACGKTERRKREEGFEVWWRIRGGREWSLVEGCQFLCVSLPARLQHISAASQADSNSGGRQTSMRKCRYVPTRWPNPRQDLDCDLCCMASPASLCAPSPEASL